MKHDFPQQKFVLLPRVKHQVHQVKRRLQDRRRVTGQRRQLAVAAVRHLAVAVAVAAAQRLRDRCRSPRDRCRLPRDNVQLKHSLNDPLQVFKSLRGPPRDVSHPL